MIDNYQHDLNDPFSALGSRPRANSNKRQLDQLQEAGELGYGDDPQDWLDRNGLATSPITINTPESGHPPAYLSSSASQRRRAHRTRIDPNRLSVSSDFRGQFNLQTGEFNTPPTPSSLADLTNGSTVMSREGSMLSIGSLGMNRLGVHSFDHMNNMSREPSQIDLSNPHIAEDFDYVQDHSYILSGAGKGVENLQSHSLSSPYVQDPHWPSNSYASQEMQVLVSGEGEAAGEEMQRSDSNDSQNSISSTYSNRSSKRLREVNIAQASTILLPKNTLDSRAKRQKTDTHQDAVAIPKRAPYVRPPQTRVHCQQCRKKPDGFRGDHELRRHMDREHSGLRKMWVCKDISADTTIDWTTTRVPQIPLSSCKACKNFKKYGAYYNAAAHLRRAHFHPRKKGSRRKGAMKDDERRGGKGGGDDPPINELKGIWMEEVQVADDRTKSKKQQKLAIQQEFEDDDDDEAMDEEADEEEEEDMGPQFHEGEEVAEAVADVSEEYPAFEGPDFFGLGFDFNAETEVNSVPYLTEEQFPDEYGMNQTVQHPMPAYYENGGNYGAFDGSQSFQ
jgi:hypothetical protein